MRYIPFIALSAVLGACATQPGADVQSVGDSQQSVRAVSQCISQKWANKSQQQVVSQDVLAGDQAVDVYVPGGHPPDGAAAVVRPARTSGQSAWAGWRAGASASSDPVDDIKACL